VERGEVAPDVRAVLPQHGDLLGQARVVGRRAVPNVGLLGDEPEHLLLARAADDDRRPRRLDGTGPAAPALDPIVAAREVDGLARPQPLDGAHGPAEPLAAHARRQEVEALGPGPRLGPAGAAAGAAPG